MAKTKSGFTFEIDKDRLDDWELVESLVQMDEDDAKGYMDFVIGLLGADQYKALKDYLKKKEGRVRITSMRREMDEIFNSVDFDEVKKS